jgi:phosphatidylserine synthase
MRKIESEYDNFLDNLFIDLSDVLDEYFYKLQFSPNDITTVSLIFSLICISLFMQKYYILSAIFYIIAFLFDCMDGHYARKHGMTSDIGDLYDHLKDYIIFGILFYLLYHQHKNSQYKYVYLIIIIFFVVLCMLHYSCQEIYYDKPSVTSKYFKMCPTQNKENVSNVLRYTKYFGCGTLILVFALFIALTDYLK